MISHEENLADDSNPLVSIIIPAYNAEPYLDECLKSTIGQTYRNIQIIVVNDGSTDRTSEICARWESEDPRVRTINKDNGGLPAARNTGIREASGTWLLFVDSDDELLPTAVEELMGFNTDVDIVSFGWTRVSDTGNYLGSVVPREHERCDERGLISEIAKGNLADYIWSYMFRRSSISVPENVAGPFAEGYTLFEDTISLQRLLRSGHYQVAFLPKALYRYRQTSSSMSRKVDSKSARAGLEAVRELEGYSIDAKMKDAWCAKLMRMLLLGADHVAGPGIGDGNAPLHREIYLEINTLAKSGGFSALNLNERIKFMLFRAYIYRPLRRLLYALRAAKNK